MTRFLLASQWVARGVSCAHLHAICFLSVRTLPHAVLLSWEEAPSHCIRATSCDYFVLTLYRKTTLCCNTSIPHRYIHILYTYRLSSIFPAASAVLKADHHCMSLIMNHTPGMSLKNRQSLFINNWTAPLVFSHSQFLTRRVFTVASSYSHSHADSGDTLLSELLHWLRHCDGERAAVTHTHTQTHVRC